MTREQSEPPRRRMGWKTAHRLLLPAIAVFLIQGLLGTANANDPSRFLGNYVGQATVEDLVTGNISMRHLDIEVVPNRQDGLRIDWITVELVNGKRDQPGVKRWSQTALFAPSDGNNFLVDVGEISVFRERQEAIVIEGDPIRWSRIDGDILHTFSFAVLEDGRYELQLYQRILTDFGMDIHFERIVDGKTVRRVIGSTARVE